jgi:ABC-2 type transport system ATP-binding protein
MSAGMSQATVLSGNPGCNAGEGGSPLEHEPGIGGGQSPLIEVTDLTKAFGSKLAVNGISFSVRRGEVLGFLGPNGAGKSTTMRMLTGFIPPSEGSISVGGYDMLAEPIPAKRMLGYLPENAPAYTDMTVFSFLSFCAELSGLRGADRRRAVHRAVELCFLESVLYQSVDTLSKGYRHRASFAQAIIHDPDILVLDEPTDGLDPNQKHEIRGLIRRMGERKAIVFSTHILEEVEAACSRALIIDRGRIVANGTPGDLKRRSELNGAVLLAVQGPTGAQLMERLSRIPNARKAAILKEEREETWARVYPSSGSCNGELVRNVLEAVNGWQVVDMRTEEGRLDEVFRSITLPDTDPEPIENELNVPAAPTRHPLRP